MLQMVCQEAGKVSSIGGGGIATILKKMGAILDFLEAEMAQGELVPDERRFRWPKLVSAETLG